MITSLPSLTQQIVSRFSIIFFFFLEQGRHYLKKAVLSLQMYFLEMADAIQKSTCSPASKLEHSLLCIGTWTPAPLFYLSKT